MQTIIPLPGQGAMRLTTARYYTPSGTSIQAKGIVPDINVAQALIDAVEEDADHLRNEADLRNSLDAEGEEDEIGARSEESRDDYQLNRALDMIEGIALMAGVVADADSSAN